MSDPPSGPGQPRILFLTLTDDVGSERIVSEMGRRGALCAVMGRQGVLAARSLRVVYRHRLPPLGGPWASARCVRRGLERMASEWRPDAVVPLDDLAGEVLREFAAAPGTRADVRLLLTRSLGDPKHDRVAASRALLIDRARDLGIRTPAQRSIRDPTEARMAAAEVGYPLFVKREATCGGRGVTMARDDAALLMQVRAAILKAEMKRALRWALGFRPDRGLAAVTLQARVAGALAMRTVACETGGVLDGLSLVADHLDPPAVGSSTVVRPLDHSEMDEAVRRLVAALGCSGFVSFDFILAPDGAAHLIEMNARPVGSGHLGPLFGHDLYGAWLRGFPGFVDAAPPGRAAAPRAVALFPKEVARDPGGAELASAGVLHDVPWDEPIIVEAHRKRLLRRPSHAGSAIAGHRGSASPFGDVPVPGGDTPSGLAPHWM